MFEHIDLYLSMPVMLRRFSRQLGNAAPSVNFLSECTASHKTGINVSENRQLRSVPHKMGLQSLGLIRAQKAH